MWLAARGYLAGIGTFLVCPCHLPLTLPIIIALTAGTAVGGWLADNSLTIYAISIVLFLSGLGVAAKWLFLDDAAACALPANPKEESHETI